MQKKITTMPCEGCQVQFTVFKRKQSCNDCKRYYCHNCLVNCGSDNNNRKHSLCERCLLFSKRPLVRTDLIKLKSKDLIFYLQSKHISTAGCVEKEELIDLVLQYVNRTDTNNQTFSCGSGSSSGNSSRHTTPQHRKNSGNAGAAGISSVDSARRSTDNVPSANNSFDSIKQTCQNFFSNLSDNISDSLANLESRACSKNTQTTNVSTTAKVNVTEQPRVATRVIPTYASSQQNSPDNPVTSQIGEEHSSVDPLITAESLVVNLPPSTPNSENYISDTKQEECNCSDDDEIIASFSGRTRSPKSEPDKQNILLSIDEQDLTTNSKNTNCAPSTSTSTSKAPSQYSKLEIYINDEDSSHSSFEELGAIGGISDDSKTTTDTTSNTTENWQMLDLKISETETEPQPQKQQPDQQTEIDKTHSVFQNDDEQISEYPAENNQKQQINQPPPTPTHVHPAPRNKKVTRRRSESYLNRRRPQTSVDNENDDVVQNSRIDEEIQTIPSAFFTTRKPVGKGCCSRCGKNKANIRQQVEKMRQHLESSQMSEVDIKQELSDFLAYLEQRTKSIEYSDSEAGVSTASISRNTNENEEEEEIFVNRHTDAQTHRSTLVCNANVDQSLESTTAYLYDKDSRFINLDDIESVKQLECLTVKQLKEILMLHRVDYKGCCEKQELLDRVERLWKNLKSSPAVEKLQTDELCKICMDAPIECVILECGHMATCTNCGKVLSECPICRQYIVRVVRFFRA